MVPAVGYALRKQNRALVGDPAWTGVEIEFFRSSDPLRLAPYLTGVRFDYVSIHSLELSVASPEPPSEAYLETLAAVAKENDAAAVSDHLAFTYGGDVGVGQVASPPLTGVALDCTCRNVELVRRRLGSTAFFLENLAHFFRPKRTMPEPEFISRVLTRTGCGWLLDVTNVWHNQLNFGDDGRDFIRAIMPAAGRVQMHLSGGRFDEESGKYVDSHSSPIPAQVWDLYREALTLGRGKVEGVFIERDGYFPERPEGLLGDLRKAGDIAREVEALP
jgi:uncharacterized protein (UPF0276 family)